MTQEEGYAQKWLNFNNFGDVWDNDAEKIGPQSLKRLQLDLKQAQANYGLTGEQTALAAANTKAAMQGIEKTLQDIEVGKATVFKLKEDTAHVKVLIDNSKLDQQQKRAFAEAWEQMGKGGAFAKEAVPFLRMLITILGK